MGFCVPEKRDCRKAVLRFLLIEKSFMEGKAERDCFLLEIFFKLNSRFYEETERRLWLPGDFSQNTHLNMCNRSLPVPLPAEFQRQAVRSRALQMLAMVRVCHGKTK